VSIRTSVQSTTQLWRFSASKPTRFNFPGQILRRFSR
jgi:hypothetical protein